MAGRKKKPDDYTMKIFFDGGKRHNLIAIVNGDNDDVVVQKRKYDNDDYEWDALELALDYALSHRHKNKVLLFGDNNQIIRWMQEENPVCGGSIIKQKCLEKMNELRKTTSIIAFWTPREQNLAGRILESREVRKPVEFKAEWYCCSKCSFKSLKEKEKNEHFYNSHVTMG